MSQIFSKKQVCKFIIFFFFFLNDGYLVLGSILSVSYVRSHDSLGFLAQHGVAFQLKTHRADHNVRNVERLIGTWWTFSLILSSLPACLWEFSSSTFPYLTFLLPISPITLKPPNNLNAIWFTLLEHWRTVLISSWMTMSTHLTQGSFSFMICFFTIASNAMSGVKSPVLKPSRRRKKRKQRRWKVCSPLNAACFHQNLASAPTKCGIHIVFLPHRYIASWKKKK